MIKQPNVAGQFYTGDPQELSGQIDAFFAAAGNVPQDHKAQVVIVPHAGYVYSGAVAAYGFKAVAKQTYTTVVVIGPSHFYGFEGAAIWPKGGFKTPLGVAPVDEDFAARLMAATKILQAAPQPFQREHSVEVEIPFIQKTFPKARIVPIVMGVPSYAVCRELAKALSDTVGQRDDVLIVVSTDMSHYFPDNVARQMDNATIEALKTEQPEAIFNGNLTRKIEQCGFTGVVTALVYAKERGLNHADVLKYANSGDVTGDRSGVVGYSATIIYGGEKPADPPAQAGTTVAPLSLDQKRTLVALARSTVDTFVRTGKAPAVKNSDPRLNEVEGAFVTLTKHGQLRGCIGNIIGQQPLIKTVRDMAVSAAAHDHRFRPVTPDELKDLEVEVSVLSKPWVITDVKDIVMGKHGVIVSRGFNGGVFLPQVATETGWSKEEFLAELCSQKAGLPPDCWKDPATQIEIFTADVFNEKDVK